MHVLTTSNPSKRPLSAASLVALEQIANNCDRWLRQSIRFETKGDHGSGLQISDGKTEWIYYSPFHEEPNKAYEFWSKHNEPWPNFHASADLLGNFPEHGIPYFVLIDASGQVVFSAGGLDEAALLAVLIKLGPAFTQLTKTPTP